ncbi:unnamed protein product [Rotaria sordida]|uniref:F-box domain-containing protein n=1 Tax=Rotaria sordida TaxID=392033 RepID=A0A819T1A3_9BILA|nr:unnamed protein product [Rotaria sordida]
MITNEKKLTKQQSKRIDLSNELIYEIFGFLDFHHTFQAFYDLNQRFRNLFLHTNLLIKINISSISKSKFESYVKHIIKPHINRINSLRLSNPFTADMCLLLFPLMTNLIRLQALTLIDIEAKYIEEILNYLSSLPILSSLIIISIDSIKNPNDIYYKIFRLSALKYCQISIEMKQHSRSLSTATDKFSSIEHLIINNDISIDQLDSLLSYVPQLRRLSIGHLEESTYNRTQKNSINLTYLTSVSIELDYVSFKDFEVLVANYFHQVQILRIRVFCIIFSVNHNQTEYLNADGWQRLISTCLPNLCVFDFQHTYRILSSNDQRQAFETLINKFNSSFWIQHQWFFDFQYHDITWSNAAIFYSINPY